MSARDESIPIRDVSAGEIKQARVGAAALDLAEIERRHAQVEADEGGLIWLDEVKRATHADRGALLAALREERAEVERLRGIALSHDTMGPMSTAIMRTLERCERLGMRKPVDVAAEAALAVGEVLRGALRPAAALTITDIGPPGPAAQLLRQMAEGGQRQVDEEMARLLSIPRDACDGEPRPGGE